MTSVYRPAVWIVALLLGVGPVCADWPQFLGPTQNNHAPAARTPIQWSEDRNVRWKTAIPGQGWSSPVIIGRQIWLTTALDDGHSLRTLCIDKATGRIIHDIEVFTPADPGHKNSFNSFASPTPVVEPGRVYVCFGANGSACIDADSGAILWRNTELKINHMEGAGSSPILYRDLYILNCDGTDQQYVVALDKTTGRIAWKTPRKTAFFLWPPPMRKAFSTPLVLNLGGQDLLISVGAYRCAAYEPQTGRETWFCTLAGYSNVARPVFADGLLYVSTGYDRAQFWAIRPGGTGDVTATHIAWKFTESSCLIPTPLVVDGRIYMPMDNGLVRCLEAATGRQIWHSRMGSAYVASPLYAGGLIYLFSTRGITTVLKPDWGERPVIVAENRLDGRLMASPAVSDNALFVRTDGHLYRIEQIDAPPTTSR